MRVFIEIVLLILAATFYVASHIDRSIGREAVIAANVLSSILVALALLVTTI